MTNNDINEYEKAKQNCWDAVYNDKLEHETQIERVSLREFFDYVFNYAFERAYQLGKEHAENKGSEWQARNNGSFTGSFIQHFDGESTVIPNRTTIAAMAMQGILANPDESFVTISEAETAYLAVRCADALLNELNKEAQ